MATKLYLSDHLSVDEPPAGLHEFSFWDFATYGFVLAADALRLWPSKSGGSIGTAVSDTAAGPTSGHIFNGGSSPLELMWISPPVSAGFTLSGTVTFNFWGRESVDVNAQFLVRLYQLTRLGSLVSLVIDSSKGVELPVQTGRAVQNWTAAPTSRTFEAGDRLILFLGLDDAGGDMVQNFTDPISLSWDGQTDGADGDSWVQLTENVTFNTTTTPAGSTVYLRDTSSDVSSGGGYTRREMWTAIGSSGTTAVGNTATGPVTLAAAANQYTISAGGDFVEWFTPQLDPVTIAGVCRVSLWLVQSGSTRNQSAIAEIARVDADGTNPTLWARGDMAQYGSSIYGLHNSRARYAVLLSGPDLTLSGGQRLRFRVYHDDSYCYPGSGDMTSGQTHTLYFNGSSEPASPGNGDLSYIVFAQNLSTYNPPGPMTSAFRVQPAVVA